MSGTITTAMATSFKLDCFQGVHQFGTHTLRIALLKSTVTTTYGATCTSYSIVGDDEVAGTTDTNYTTKGAALACASTFPKTSGTGAICDFDDVSWTASTISSSGAVIYNDTNASDKAISVHNFAAVKSSSAGTFTITFPTADTSNAILRLA